MEMLQAMYPEEGAIVLDNPLIVQDVRNYLDHDGPAPVNIAFTVKINWIEQDASLDTEDPILIELYCNFPHEYPSVTPEVFVRCDILQRDEQKDLNTKLREHVDELIGLGELCIVPTLQWIQENLSNYISHSAACTSKTLPKEPISAESDNKLSRLLLYMHHIYSKTKRKVIVEWAEELNLTGFCLPGKPGVLCVEGDEKAVSDYFARLRRLNWKRITSRHREDSYTLQRKFTSFEEVAFSVHGGRNYHMDLGQFSQYLQDHDLGEMFQIIFGVDGK
ncbi:uncharacterized protein TRIADDRAFT_54187 [Trichoplax adhaerens]|uniref:RWD domain-containing protein n=1 Tax=Trichoplax adhaerens TaxID=10228 RepID=B3RRC6_TRIAD|nr:hypothetical protein TRIADDRAFT_54187 [Trichoplax adhaerens]EDV26854.1 hypothetical protein TRIADDRAFT_54187 [Trichoplax adhaerens]|eukprot:XP_002110850.1 hypothetical protein TRIADDRAFT_54187 [Trichoplax adhaerens]